MKLLASDWFDSGVSPPARFKLRGLTGLEFMDFMAQLKADGYDVAAMAKTGIIPFSSRAARVCLAGLVDWDGLRAPDSEEPLAFTPAARDWLDFPTVQEVYFEILGRTRMSADQEKNSSSQPRSRSTGTTSTARAADGAAPASDPAPAPSRGGSAAPAALSS